ncbi:MAG: 5'-methylthioadenosine/adenosylhomocysteine nucleosidase [Desulfobulbaceae bacterium]|nr:MAG: 5'-methylthioadenosine/adenosylhomocysteine nucleosidase [Desulfobulbaceae bacterium]
MKFRISLVFVISLFIAAPCFSMSIGVISAMDAEQRSFLAAVADKQVLADQVTKGTYGNHTIYATLSGIGKVNAAAVAQKLISSHQVDAIIFSGVAGGINPDLNIGDIVVASAAFQHDYGFLGASFLVHATGTVPELGIGTGDESIYFDLSQNWPPEMLRAINTRLGQSTEPLQQAMVNGQSYTPLLKIGGIVATGDQFIANETKKEALHKLKADVVEMEGGAVAQVASQNKIPLLIIRSVSDKAGEQAEIDFKTFFAAVAHNNAVVVKTVLETIP